MITANRFCIGIFCLVLVFGLNLYAPAAAFDSQYRECPPSESSMTANWEYPEGWELLWDPTNPEEINRNSSVNISAIGGVSPYKWSVSGTGFWLSSDETEGLSNTLNADDTACGSATITVTDGPGDVAIGYVRCASGYWVLKGHYCGLSGMFDEQFQSGNWPAFRKTVGNQRQEQYIHSMTYAGGCAGVDCSTVCDTYGYETEGECIFVYTPWCDCYEGGHPIYGGTPGYGYCQVTYDLYYNKWECEESE